MERKRNIVRLTENQLNRLITESVKKALNEYDPDDYYLNQQSYISKDILDGMYDDKLFDDRFVNDLLEDYDDLEWGGRIKSAIEDRRKEIDRDYAMEYGYKTYDDKDVNYEKNYRLDDYLYNYGINSNGDPKLDDTYWKDHEKRKDPMYDIKFKKNGERRSVGSTIRKFDKEFGWKFDANEKPLHRKGSMNRDLMNIDKQNESRLHRIVSESINRVLKNK